MDPVAVIRSKRYVGALVLAAIAGIPISAIAYGFLASVSAIQRFLFTELPNQMLGGPAPAWWPLPWLVLCGLLVALTIRYLPGQWRTFARIGLSNRRRTGDRTRAASHHPCCLSHTRPRRRAQARSTPDRNRRAWCTGRPPGEEGRATDGLDDHGVGPSSPWPLITCAGRYSAQRRSVVNVTATDRSYPKAARRSCRSDRTASVSATVTTVDSGPSKKSISMSIRPPTFAARTNDSCME
jgi:hypothetical protein